MPQILPATLPNGRVGTPYSQVLTAEKVVDFTVRHGGNEYEHGGLVDIGIVSINGENRVFYVNAINSPDDVALGPNAVSINNEVNCTVVVIQPPEDVDATTEAQFTLVVTPLSDGPISFTLSLNHDSAIIPQPFELDIIGLGAPNALFAGEGFTIESFDSNAVAGPENETMDGPISFDNVLVEQSPVDKNNPVFLEVETWDNATIENFIP